MKTTSKETELDRFVARPPGLTVLTDQPLTDEQVAAFFERDPFNFRYKLGPVYDILRYRDPKDETDSRTPMAILISGGWGTGKTSAMKWLDALLEKWEPTDTGVKVHRVWFYPWKYDKKEDVWRGLIAEVIIKSINVKNLTEARLHNAVKQFGMFMGKSFLHALASVKLSGEVSVGVAKGAAEVDGTFLKDIATEYKEAAHPENAYLNEFEDSLKAWINSTLGKDERLVIFIDDLDRCMPEIALQVLEALKLYLNIPRLIFVVGVDRDVVDGLVVEHFRKLGLVRPKTQDDSEEDKRQRKTEEDKAKQYLCKMFQVEVELAPTHEQVRAFLGQQLEAIPYWRQTLSEEQRELFADLVLKLVGHNPRDVKRFLNSALMAGGGAALTPLKTGGKPLGFARGFQDFFLRKLLPLRWTRLDWMVDTHEGVQFFADWSRFVSEYQQLEKQRSSGPEAETSQEGLEREDQSDG
jgi:hypothetical protein